MIIPVHNLERYIDACLASVEAQTFGDFEALCVDDGSTDGTLEAARKAVGDDARFSFFLRRRGAVCRAQCGHRPRDGEVHRLPGFRRLLRGPRAADAVRAGRARRVGRLVLLGADGVRRCQGAGALPRRLRRSRGYRRRHDGPPAHGALRRARFVLRVARAAVRSQGLSWKNPEFGSTRASCTRTTCSPA